MLLGSRLTMTSTTIFIAAAIGLLDCCDASVNPAFGGPKLSGLNQSDVAEANDEERVGPYQLIGEAALNHAPKALAIDHAPKALAIEEAPKALVIEEDFKITSSLQPTIKDTWNIGFLKMSKLSAKDAFYDLGLEDARLQLLRHPCFKAWTDHVDRMNNGNLQKATADMVEVLLPLYDDVGMFVKMLAVFRDVPATEDISTRLQTAVVNSWVGVTRTDYENMFKTLRLDSRLDTQIFKVWMEYVVKTTDKDEAIWAMTDTLKSFKNHWNLDDLLKMLTESRKDKALKDFAIGLVQRVVWMYGRNLKGDAESVFILLGLNIDRDEQIYKLWADHVMTQFRYPNEAKEVVSNVAFKYMSRNWRTILLV